ncbi:hypothetical protein KY347_05315 [Candidatus Woesearchaeota archaeon]|nr:hypothetical protein [Candidatus Woesearchaeota archaeon]
MKPQINLEKGVHIVDEEGYIEGSSNSIDSTTYDLVNRILGTDSSAIIYDQDANRGEYMAYFAVRLRCAEKPNGRASDRVGILITPKTYLIGDLTEVKKEIEKKVNETTFGLYNSEGTPGGFYPSANSLFSWKFKLDEQITEYIVLKKGSGVKPVKFSLEGLCALPFWMESKEPLSAYITDSIHAPSGWDFDLLLITDVIKAHEDAKKHQTGEKGRLDYNESRLGDLEAVFAAKARNREERKKLKRDRELGIRSLNSATTTVKEYEALIKTLKSLGVLEA